MKSKRRRESDRTSCNTWLLKLKEVNLDNDEKHNVHLEDYGFGEPQEDVPDECRTKRTKFLQWAKNVKRVSVLYKEAEEHGAVAESSHSKPTGDSLDVFEFDIEVEDNVQRNRTVMETSVEERVIETLHETDSNDSNRLNIQRTETPEGIHGACDNFGSNDSLDKYLIGKNIPVHASNLVEPKKERKTRELNQEHVKNLEIQLKTITSIYTVLVGYIEEECDLSTLSKPGGRKVEVLGGNHTRQALLNIKADITVTMNIYSNLTVIDALKLGWRHNEIHKHSRHASFEESVRLFRGILLKIKEDPNVGAREAMSQWRDQICVLTDTPKTKLNRFQTHLHVASLDQVVWEKMELLFIKWNDKKIIDQPGPEMKQTHLTDLFRISDTNKKCQLLESLSNGTTSFKDFKRMCLKRPATEKKSDNKTKERKKEMKDVKKTERREQQAEHEEDVSENVLEQNGETQIFETTYKDLESQNKKMTNQNKELEILNTELRCTNKELENKNQDLKIEVKRLNTLVQTYTKKLENHGNYTEKEKQQQTIIKGLKDELTEKNKCIDNLTEQLNRVQDSANRARKEIKDLKKNKIDDKDSKTEKINLPKEKNTDCNEVTINIQENREEQPVCEEVALVEYTNKRLFLGVLRGSEMVYTKSSVGKLTPEFKLKDSSFQLNLKDIQEINKSYIIIKIKCCVIHNKITLTEENKLVINNSVSEYLGKNEEEINKI